MSNNCVCTFAFEKQVYKTGSPASFIGRDICCLKCYEKENPMIGKLLRHIRQPSAKELDELNKRFKIIVTGSKCFLFEKEGGKLYRLKNLGTAKTPAFFYRNFIFVKNSTKNTFSAIDLKVAYMGENYVLMWISDDLMVVFERRGLALLGHIEEVHLTSKGYVIKASRIGFSAVYAACDDIKLLFVLTESSKYQVDNASGIVTHEYQRVIISPEIMCDTYLLGK